MSRDIVTRLRERAASEAANESYFNSLLYKAGLREYMINSLSYEAADEIERLRRTIKVLEYTLEASEDAQNE